MMKIIVILYWVVRINEVNSHCGHQKHVCSDHDDDETDYDDAPRRRNLVHRPIHEHIRSFERLSDKYQRRFPPQDSSYKEVASSDLYETELLQGPLSMGMYSFPYAVAIMKKRTLYANGVLVSMKWALSSAKEFHGKHPKDYILHMGSHNTRLSGIMMKIKKILIYPLYIYNTPNYDISLIKLKFPVQLTQEIRPINWVNGDLSVFLTIYWPKVVINGRQLPENASEWVNHHQLRSQAQTSIYREECSKRLLKDNLQLELATICFNPIQNMHSPCLADAGAPILSYTGLMGISSSWVSPKCKQSPSNSPVYVTRISSPMIRSWMRDVMRLHLYDPKRTHKAKTRRGQHTQFQRDANKEAPTKNYSTVVKDYSTGVKDKVAIKGTASIKEPATKQLKLPTFKKLLSHE